MTTLQNKIVVVVGGSSGIGFGVALASLQSLASKVIIASSNADRVAGAVKRLQEHNLPGEVTGEVLDARDTEAVKQFAERLGEVDHIAWTSGDSLPGRMNTGGNPTEDDKKNAFAVRFWGPFVLAQHAKFKSGGSLTLTSGVLDMKPRPGASGIAGVGAALEGLAKGLAVDLAPVRVNLVGPGLTETEIIGKMQIPPEALNKALDTFISRQLIKRMGQPEEIAEAYVFLMKCGYITGQRITIDGGYVIG